jgi:hypothetical protein
MRFASSLIATVLLSGLALVSMPAHLSAQESSSGDQVALAADLPDAPQPQNSSTNSSAEAPQNPAPSQTGKAPDPQDPPAAPPATTESRRQKAEEQIKAQEHQRVMGIIPAFNISYLNDAVSLTPGQKFRLAFRSAVDPYTFAIAGIVAGIGEVNDSDPGFGWGPLGYGKRAGAAYLDAFDGTMIGNAFLPVILHQDPRYFRLGHGTVHHRLLYAVATSFICKHDNTGKWEPNYSNVLGNIASGALSNLYYPGNTSFGQTIEDGLTVTFEGTFGATLQEFWPDISRKLFHKDPTNGLDALAREGDEAKKKSKQDQSQGQK